MQENKFESILTLPDRERLKGLLVWGTLATAIFVSVYGYCNKAAAEASSHYSLYSDWELHIPLIPWMIFPYVSLNLLFLVCAFILKTKESIKGLCLSLIWGAVLAGIVFYFFPGKLGFQRAMTESHQEIFAFMFSIDHPHNLFPSLHVTYSSLAIFAMIDQTRSKAFHSFLYIWLLFIAISVVFVHQHHLFDILTGALLARELYRRVYRRYSSFETRPLNE